MNEEYNLSTKNEEGKWWTYGNLKTNQWGNKQVSFNIENLKKLVALAESKNSQWINLSLFERENKAEQKHSQEKGNAYVKDLDDDIGF